MTGETHSTTHSTVGSLTVLGRVRGTRGVTFFILMVALTPILIGLTLWGGIERIRRPDSGLVIDDRLAVDSVDARWSGVARGDRVADVGGVPPRDPADFVRRSLARRGPLQVTFYRGDDRFTRVAEVTPMRLADMLAVFARFLTAVALMVMGLIAFTARPGASVTWLLLLLAWVLGLFLLLKIGLWWDPRLERTVATYPWMFAVSVGLHLFCFFPRRIGWLADNPRRAAWLYAPLLIAPVVHALALHTPLQKLGTFYGAGAALLVTAILAVQYRGVRAANDPHGRSQYRALLAGFGFGLLLPGAWNWLRFFYGFGGPWAAHYNAIPLIVFVGTIAYAVVRHNALAIDRFTASVVGYATTTIVLGGAFAAALLGIPLLVGESGMADSPLLLVGVTALTFAGFAPLYRRIKRWVDRRFFREQADAAQIADSLRSLVLTMQQSGRDDAIEAALAATNILNSEQAEVWLLSEDKKQIDFVRGAKAGPASPEPVTLDGALGQALASGVTAGLEGLSPRAMEATAQEELWSKECAMAAPVMVHGVLAGFLGVGRKRSGIGYRLEELSYLAIVAAQLGSVLERSRSENAQLDRYILERRVGSGGMAEVFLAWQIGPGGFERRVALKRPLPHLTDDANAAAAFLDEARLSAQLQHLHIAQVYDVGESEGGYFIVMEYVDGPSVRQLGRRLKDRGERMPFPIAVAITAAVLSALDYAHRLRDEDGRSLRLVHRDVTPRNVLLNRRGEPKLVDFGIARAQHQLHVTRTGTIKGTLPYMSPEQASGERLDHRSDLYSAGVLLYELLTGRLPYPDGPLSFPPQRVTEIVSDLPVALEAVLLRSMAYQPERRYPSAGVQRQALLDAIKPRAAATAEQVATWLSEIYGDQPEVDASGAPTMEAPQEAVTEPSPGEETVAEPPRRPRLGDGGAR